MNDAPRSPSPGDALVLGDLRLDLAAGLLRDASGGVLPLRPQVWSMLRLLARNAGRLVTKDEMLEAVWPGLVVTDASIAQAVSDVRAALGEAGHRLVRTVPRRGYMLVAAAPAAAAAPAHAMPHARLPAAPALLFGRAHELDALQALLEQHRLVTVVGAGGIGKTVLALAAAHRASGDLADGAAWVELAPIADATLLPSTLAHALDLPTARVVDPLPALLAAMKDLCRLVVLDNAEHLVDALARLARALLDAAPGLKLLVTSQAPLRIEGEHVFRLDALEVPPADAALEVAAHTGAVALFVERAQAADPSFVLTEANLAAVIRLCSRLDGLPLAIRLAAARAPLLGLAGLEQRLGERLRLLTGGDRDAPTRQQTLLAALEWSHGLLAEREQRVFRRLGVFVGSFDLALAVAVCRDDTLDDWGVIDAIGQLVERSLVTRERGDAPRHHLLESARAFALRELALHGEAASVDRRHAHAMAAAMETALEQFFEMPDAPWLARWASELDNARAALEWSAKHDPATFVVVAGGAANIFRLFELGGEMRRRLDTIEPDAVAALTAKDRLRYWLLRSYLMAGVEQGRMHEYALNAEAIARGLGEDFWLYVALAYRAMSGLVAPAERSSLLAQIVQLEPRPGTPRLRTYRWGAEYCLHDLEGRWPEALHAAETGLAIAVELGNEQFTSAFANWLLIALLDLGRIDEALRRSGELLPLIPARRNSLAIPFLGTCARCSLRAGDVIEAKRRLAVMFDRSRATAWQSFHLFGELYAGVALAEGRSEAAARLLGYTKAARARAWFGAKPTRHQDRMHAALETALGPGRCAELMAQGEGLDEETVCSLVLAAAPF